MDSIQDNRKKYGKIGEIITKLKKVKNIEIAIAVILLAVILLIYAGVTNYSNKTSKALSSEKNNSKDALEMKLESILSEISGAGKVKVMITYDGSIEYITANTSNINTNTSTDNNRTTKTTSTTTSPVIVNNNGSSGPVFIKEIEPKVKGVIVVAEGADNIKVRIELMRAVMVALNIGAENIEIFDMNK